MFMEDLRSQVVENENKKQNYKNEILSLQNKISKYDHETKLRKSNLQTTFVDMLQIKAKVERQIQSNVNEIKYSCPKCDILKNEESKLDIQTKINNSQIIFGDINDIIVDN